MAKEDSSDFQDCLIIPVYPSTDADSANTHDDYHADSRLSATAQVIPAEVRLLLLLCRHPFEHGAQEQATELCEDISNWDDFLQLAAHHRVMPFVAKNAAAIPLPANIFQQLRAYSATNAIEAFRSIAETQRLLDLLSEAGIEPTILKGIPLSLQAFKDVSTRDVGDIDLLIAPSEAETVDSILQAHGWTRKDPEGKLTPRRRASYARHFKDYTYEPVRMQSEGGFEVDLHWRLFRNPHLPANQLAAEERESVSVGSLNLRTLAPSTQLLYLAVQGSVDGWTRFKAVADFAALWQAVPDNTCLSDRALNVGALPHLCAALHLAEAWIGGIPIPEPYDFGNLSRREASLARSIRDRAGKRMKAAAFLPPLRETSSWKMKRYEAALHPSFSYKLAILRRVLFRPRVWHRFDLPDALFPLYPLLSPIEWLMVHLGRKGGNVRRRSRPISDWLYLLEAGATLVLCRAALRLLPVPRIVRWIRRPMSNKTSGSAATIEQCRWAVTAFSRNAPVRLVCFPQALALYAMLRHRGIASEVLYGAARLDSGELAAHAWLRFGGVILVGGETAGRFSVLDTWKPS